MSKERTVWRRTSMQIHKSNVLDAIGAAVLTIIFLPAAAVLLTILVVLIQN